MSLPDPSPKLTLLELAEHRLRTLFPKHFPSPAHFQSKTHEGAPSSRVSTLASTPPPAVVEPKAAAQAVASTKCAERGCVWPALADGKCRGHYLDSKCEKSLLPSTTACAIDNLGMMVSL